METKRLVIIVDLEEWYTRDRKPEEVAQSLMTAEGEYDYSGTLIDAKWIDKWS